MRTPSSASLCSAVVIAIACSYAARADELSEYTDDDHAQVVHLALEPLVLGESTFNGVTLALSGRIASNADIDVAFIQRTPQPQQCSTLALVANGHALVFHGKLASSLSERHVRLLDGEGDEAEFVASVHAQLARGGFATLAGAQRVAVRACGQTYELTKAQRANLVELAARLAKRRP
jgi:hypothetical protein